MIFTGVFTIEFVLKLMAFRFKVSIFIFIVSFDLKNMKAATAYPVSDLFNCDFYDLSC